MKNILAVTLLFSSVSSLATTITSFKSVVMMPSNADHSTIHYEMRSNSNDTREMGVIEGATCESISRFMVQPMQNPVDPQFVSLKKGEATELKNVLYICQ